MVKQDGTESKMTLSMKRIRTQALSQAWAWMRVRTVHRPCVACAFLLPSFFSMEITLIGN
jgi:hypothetical protein